MKSQLSLIQEALQDKTIQQQQLMFAQGFHAPKTALVENTGFTDQVGAFIRQTNTVYNLALAMNEPIFVPEKGYNPAEDPDVIANPWIEENYPAAFVNLMKSESGLETNALMEKIQSEHRDRMIIQSGGLPSNILSGLTAGFVDPVNWVAFRGATKVAKALNLALRPPAVAAIGVAENLAALTAAEPFLQLAQQTRTGEEFRRDLVGGALFGGILGGMGGAFSSGRTATTRALLGADTAEDAIDPASYSAWLQRNPVEQQRLDELLETDKGFAIFGEDRAELAGILLKATRDINPGLARVLGTANGNILGRLLVKMLFLNPEANLARSESQFARGALDILLKPAIVRTDTLNRQSVEAIMGIAEIASLQLRHNMDLVYARYRKDGGSVRSVDLMEMAGKAAVRGDVVDPENASLELSLSDITGSLEEVNPFESIRGDANAIKAVEEIAKINRKFFDALRKTAVAVGALTDQQFLSPADLANYLTRRYKTDKIKTYEPKFRQAVYKSLEEKRATELPDLEVARQRLIDERDALVDPTAPPPSPEDLAEIAWDRARLDREIAEHDEWIGKLGDESRWEEISDQVYENITNDSGSGPLGGGSGNSLKQRMLTVEDRFLAPFIERNVSVIQADQIKNLIPNLILGSEMDKVMDGFQVSARVQSRLTTVTARLDALAEDPSTLTPAALESAHLELEKVLDDASHLRLSSYMRLQTNVKRMGFSSMQDAQEHLNGLVTSLKELRTEVHARRKLVKELDADIARSEMQIQNLLDQNRAVPVAVQKSLDDLVVERAAKNRELSESMGEFSQSRGAINNVAGKLIFAEKSFGNRLGSSSADRTASLRFGRNFISDGDAITDLQKLQQLMEMRKMVTQRAISSRRSAYDINVDSEQVNSRITEDYSNLRAGVSQNSRMTMKRKKRELEKLNKKEERDKLDMAVIFERFKRTDGVGNETMGRVSKSIRELNYIRLGGGFLLSSVPDLAMGIGQVGLPSYIRALARYMNPFFRNRRLSEDMSDWVFANEAVLGGERNKRIAGIDDLDPNRTTVLEKGLGKASERFSDWLQLNKWNGMMKAINSVAIQNKILKIGNRFRSGKRLSRSDKAFLEGLGLDEERMKRISILQEEFGDTESTLLGGKFYLARTRKWGAGGGIDARTALEDRMAFERAVFQRVQQTIITPGAGSLPRWMTGSEVGRVIGQFGSFTMSATTQLLVPMLQKGAIMGDFNQAIMFVGASMLGAVSYWARAALDGKDPFEDEVKRDRRGRVISRVPWWKKSIMEGIDRGGTLGWLTQGNAITERMTGVGVSTLFGAGQLSRMKARSKVDLLAGPTAGFLNDMGSVLSGLAAKGIEGKPFTAANYNAMRRMTPWQNLLQTRLALDVAPSVYDMQRGGYKSPSYFDKFQTLQSRTRDYLQGE